MDQIDSGALVLDFILRFLAAAGMGAILGIDREARGRQAGLRTHMLTALAAATFTVVTSEMHKELMAQNHQGGDPLRVIEAITVGVSFLAAGTIVQRGRNVQGITTGAGLWLAGALGLACGLAEYVIAGIVLVLAMITLTVIGWIEARWERRRE
ncbi:MAG: MgtC/SapB family protein [Parvibaculaceae bacterium]